MKKFLLVAMLSTAFIISGCKLPETSSQPAVPTLPPVNVTCNELSFYLDPALGSGYDCQTVPESLSLDRPSYYVFIYPAHTELTIQNYPLTRTQFPPQVWIYPVNRFTELLPKFIPPRLSDLEKIISNNTPVSASMPFLPVIPQTQVFAIHVNFVPFNGGQGVRFITEYNESPTPITNRTIIYTFQGLTDDGLTWVAVTLPISNPILSDSNETLPEGWTQERMTQDYNSYGREVQDALAAQALTSFYPSLTTLDNLVRSITIRQ